MKSVAFIQLLAIISDHNCCCCCGITA